MSAKTTNRRRRLVCEMAAYQDGLCFLCNEPMTLPDMEMVGADNSPKRASIEHIVPRSLGGNNGVANLVAACRDCNSRRGKALPTEVVLQRLGVLNEARADWVQRKTGKFDPTTWGPITPATATLVEVIDEIEDGILRRRVQRMVTKRLQNFFHAMNCLDRLDDHWERIVLLFIEDFIAQFKARRDIPETVRSLLENVVRTTFRKRLEDRKKKRKSRRSNAECRAASARD